MIEDSYMDSSGEFWWRQFGRAPDQWWEGYWNGEQDAVNHIVRIWLR